MVDGSHEPLELRSAPFVVSESGIGGAKPFPLLADSEGPEVIPEFIEEYSSEFQDGLSAFRARRSP